MEGRTLSEKYTALTFLEVPILGGGVSSHWVQNPNMDRILCDCSSYRKRSKEVLTNWQKEKLFPWLQTAIWTLCNVLCVNVCVGIDGCFNLRFCDELAAGGGECCTGDMCDSKHLVLVVHVTICCRGRVLHPVALALSVLATTVTDRLSLSISRPVPSFLSAVTPLPFGFFKWSLATSYLSHFRYYLQLQFFSQKLYILGL